MAGGCSHRLRESQLEGATFEQIEGASFVDTDKFSVLNSVLA